MNRKTFKSPQNVGVADRIIRSAVGLWLLYEGTRQVSTFGPIKMLMGGLLLLTGATGVDPILSRLGTSTRYGARNNIIHMAKQFLPGPGILPKLTEQAIPKNRLMNSLKKGMTLQTLAQQLAVR